MRVSQPVQPDLAAPSYHELRHGLCDGVGLQGQAIGSHDDVMLRREANADRQHSLRLGDPVTAQFLHHEGGEAAA
jgi:hypothetical protein